ncbi:MAG: DUF1801 domain-containing protein [Shimia sp.]|uniref:DUF1801 domain-containing protein n=1 Tax=Shimia sp. TaxID=1954381 RepID=UPI004059D983
MTATPPDISNVLAATPAAPRAVLSELHALILETAADLDALPLTENLKWGQPSFAPPKRDGTPIRLSWSEKSPNHVALLVHCQTSLVNAWRDRFGDAFTYDGTRALHVPLDAPLNQVALRHAIAMALTYRRPAPETAS